MRCSTGPWSYHLAIGSYQAANLLVPFKHINGWFLSLWANNDTTTVLNGLLVVTGYIHNFTVEKVGGQ